MDCHPVGICETCSPGTTKNCSAIKTFDKWTLDQYGYVLGGADVDAVGAPLNKQDKLKAEIMQNGPIACGIHANDKLEAYGVTTPVDHYPGGIFKEFDPLPLPNHILSIVGWGEDKTVGESYWILR